MPGTGHAPRRRDGRPFFVTRLPCRPRTLPVCFAHGGMIFGSVQSTRPVPAQAARRPDRTSTGIAARAAASARGTILKACKAVFAASAAAGPSAAHAPLCNNLPRHCAAGGLSGWHGNSYFPVLSGNIARLTVFHRRAACRDRRQRLLQHPVFIKSFLTYKSVLT